MEFKGKEKRAICYSARDKYFECLELNQDDKEKCTSLYPPFEELCGANWTSHFIRRRQYLKYQERYLKEGPSKIDSESIGNNKGSQT